MVRTRGKERATGRAVQVEVDGVSEDNAGSTDLIAFNRNTRYQQAESPRANLTKT